MAKKTLESPKSKYKQGAAYEWEENAYFPLTGIEFSIVFNTLKDHIYRPGGASISNIMDAYNVLNKVFLDSVERGVSTEIQDKSPQ